MLLLGGGFGHCLWVIRGALGCAISLVARGRRIGNRIWTNLSVGSREMQIVGMAVWTEQAVTSAGGCCLSRSFIFLSGALLGGPT